MLTPIKKPPGAFDWEKEQDEQSYMIRYVMEQAIANFKTWPILHTDYRRPLETFHETISATVAIHLYRIACE